MSESELSAAFVELRQVLEPYLDQERVQVKTDEPGSLYLEKAGTGTPELFSAVALKKSYVSFHYMPVYSDPALLDGLSAGLLRRMQGKSCFNFKRPDDPAIAELAQLVAATADDFLSQ